MSADNLVLEIPCVTHKTGEEMLRLRILREGPMNYAMNPSKIAQLWLKAKDHDVLFSDYTEGKFEPFLDVLMDPRGVFLEIVNDEDDVIGLMYLSDVVPGFDAYGHFTFWDAVASGREPLALFAIEQIMDRYKLHRLSAMIPVYQSGTIRFTEKLGFKREGEIREAIPHKGRWMPAYHYGILRNEVEEQIERMWGHE